MKKQHSPCFVALVTAAKVNVEETDIYSVKKMIQEGEDFDLIDVREESEWDNGHLPGAIHLGKGVIERDLEKVIPNNQRKLVLYCGSGFRSALAADSIQKMGYRNVLSMGGGVIAWKEAGFLVVND
ncbi:rhodanese-like domain-containing protein [Candidatus Coxiella mudrowiae]|uniref:rhodanese-like domain-containing protein n=1 Tax=Candidatus Coxiella mudrowiae TaxID=2054173 RepID=UPI000C287D99|nr:rhodanese-like domain-containing protein [Candidatus Coxiella mudrowiae]